jgi:hypothetical protein
VSNPKSRSGQQLSKAIRKLVAGLEKQTRIQNERRRYTRYSFNARVQLCVKSESGEYQTLCDAWASDLSLGGIGCLAEQEISDLALIYIGLESLVGHPCYIPVRPRFCRTLLSHTYKLHGEFVYDEDAGTDQVSTAA